MSLGTAMTNTTALIAKYLFVLLDSQADSSPEVLHQNLRLFHLGRVNLRPHHGTERHLHSDRNASNVCCYGMTENTHPSNYSPRARRAAPVYRILGRFLSYKLAFQITQPALHPRAFSVTTPKSGRKLPLTFTLVSTISLPALR